VAGGKESVRCSVRFEFVERLAMVTDAGREGRAQPCISLKLFSQPPLFYNEGTLNSRRTSSRPHVYQYGRGSEVTHESEVLVYVLP
jgi:hypothetical protein